MNKNFHTPSIVPGLPAKRLWDSIVLAYGCQDHIVMSGAEISELSSCVNV